MKKKIIVEIEISNNLQCWPCDMIDADNDNYCMVFNEYIEHDLRCPKCLDAEQAYKELEKKCQT